MSKQTEETAARTAAQETFDHAYQHPRLPGYRCAQCGATAADHARAEQTTSASSEAGEHTPAERRVADLMPDPHETVRSINAQASAIQAEGEAIQRDWERWQAEKTSRVTPALIMDYARSQREREEARAENARLRETLRDILHYGHVGADVKARISIELAKAEGRAQ